MDHEQRGDEAEDGGALCQSAADQQGAVDLTGGLRLAGDGLAGLSGGDSDSDAGSDAGENSQSDCKHSDLHDSMSSFISAQGADV